MDLSNGSNQSVSISDVAREADVSKATVSRVLNHRPHVTADKRERVKAAAQRLGFHINPVIASIAQKRFRGTDQAGGVYTAFLTRSRREDLTGLARKFTQTVSASGLMVEHFDTLQHPDAKQLSKHLQKKGVVLVVLHRILKNDGFFDAFNWSPFVALSLDRAFLQPRLPLIREAQTGLVLEAVQHLRKLGYRKIAAVLPWRIPFRQDNFRYLAGWQGAQALIEPESRCPALCLDFEQPTQERWSLLDAYLKTHQPDALLAYSSALVTASEPKVCPSQLKKLPTVYLRATTGDSGFHDIEKLCFEQAATTALRLIRSSSYGLLPNPAEVLVTPRWESSKNLPRRGALCPLLEKPIFG